jgi:hypothetical protein
MNKNIFFIFLAVSFLFVGCAGRQSNCFCPQQPKKLTPYQQKYPVYTYIRPGKKRNSIYFNINRGKVRTGAKFHFPGGSLSVGN